MKLIEIVGKEKATSIEDLIDTIRNGKFTKDGSHLIVKDTFIIGEKKLTSLTGCPQEIRGNFSCSFNNLTSLEGCPQIITGNFFCNDNLLTTLRGCPKEVGDDFYCYNNRLTSLVGGPRKVGGYYYCQNNRILSLEGCAEEIGENFSGVSNAVSSLKDIHKHIKKLNGIFYISNNDLRSHILGVLKIQNCGGITTGNKKLDDIINKYLPLGDLLDCQEELIEAGFEEFAQL